MQFSDVTSLVSKGLMAGGGFILVFAVIGIGLGFKDHEGSKIQSSIFNAIAGAMIVAAAVMVNNITL